MFPEISSPVTGSISASRVGGDRCHVRWFTESRRAINICSCRCDLAIAHRNIYHARTHARTHRIWFWCTRERKFSVSVVTRWSASDVSSDTRCDRLMIYENKLVLIAASNTIRWIYARPDLPCNLRWNRRRFSLHLFQSNISDTFRNIGNAISGNIIDCCAKRITCFLQKWFLFILETCRYIFLEIILFKFNYLILLKIKFH